jgi:flagellin-like protein
MRLKNLLTDDDAVSPVIGVILMVAITVILAAVIGTFVLGLGDQVSDSAPQASFSFETTTYDPPSGGSTTYTAVEITHDGGDAIAGDNINVLVDGTEAYGATSSDEIATPFTGELTAGTSTTIVAATSVDVEVSSESNSDSYTDSGTLDTTSGGDSDSTSDVALSSDEEVRVVWSSSSSGDTSTLGQFTIP